MGNQLGEALQASRTKKSILVARTRINGVSTIKKNGCWNHYKNKKSEEYNIPQNFNTFYKKETVLKACSMFLFILNFNMFNIPGYANLEGFKNFKPIISFFN